MIINLSLQDNYKFHLNNAIKLLNRAMDVNEQYDYLMGFLSSAIALELGLKLAVKETIKGDIFARKKNGSIKLDDYGRQKTKNIFDINILIKNNFFKFEENILNNFSVKIDSAIIEEEIKSISEIRNCLFHYEGEFETQRIIKDIVKAFIFLNILLSPEFSLTNLLFEKENFVALLKAIPSKFNGILTNINEIVVHKDNYFDINIEGEETCSECGYEAIISLVSEKGYCYLCLLCSYHDYFVECADCGIKLPQEQIVYSDPEAHTFLCENCYNLAFR